MGFLGTLIDGARALSKGDKAFFQSNPEEKKEIPKKEYKKYDYNTTLDQAAYSYSKSGLERASYQYKKYGSLNDGNNYKKEKKKQENIKNQEEYNKEYAEKHTEDRGIVSRLLGMLGYGGVVEGLYNTLDDDEKTTFLSGLREGLHYMNPATDNIEGAKYGSNLVELLEQPDSNPDKLEFEDVLKTAHKTFKASTKANIVPLRFLNEEKISKAVYGLGYDIALDPLTYVGGLYTAPFKILKGSGYGTDVVKAVKNAEGASSVRQVAKKLRELNASTDADQIAKFQQYTGTATADDFMETARSYHVLDYKYSHGHQYKNAIGDDITKNIDDAYEVSEDVIKQTAETMAKEYNQTVKHMLFDGDVKQGVTVGFDNLPFASKKGSVLRKEIVKNDTLKKIGDSTISPYYNNILKKVRTSKLNKAFKTNNIERIAKVSKYSNEDTQNLFGLSKLMPGLSRILKDSELFENSQKIEEFVSTLSKDELYSFIQSVEDGTFKNAMDYIKARKALFDQFYKVNEDGEIINLTSDEFLDRTEIDEVLSALNKSDEIEKSIQNYINEFLGKVTDEDNAIYRFITGKTSNMSTSDLELAENIQLVEAYKNVKSWKDLLSNAKFSDNPAINAAKQKIIQQGDEVAAQKAALSLEKDELIKALNSKSGQFIMTNNTKDIIRPNKKDIEKLSTSIIKNNYSKADPKEFSYQIAGLFDQIVNKNIPIEELKNLTKNIVREIIENAEKTDDTLYKNYENLRKQLKETKMVLFEVDKGDFADGYSNFRKKNAGKFKLTKDGKPVDDVYMELSELYPELFDIEKYTHPADQLKHIAEVLDDIKPIKSNPHVDFMDEIIEEVSDELLLSLFDISRGKNSTPRHISKLKKLRKQYENSKKKFLDFDNEIGEFRKTNYKQYDNKNYGFSSENETIWREMYEHKSNLKKAMNDAKRAYNVALKEAVDEGKDLSFLDANYFEKTAAKMQSFIDDITSKIKAVDDSISSLPENYIKNNEITEDGWKYIFKQLTPEERTAVLKENPDYQNASPLHQLTMEVISNSKLINDFVGSEVFEKYRYIENFLLDDVNQYRIGTEKTPSAIDSARSTFEKIEKISDLNNYLRAGKDIADATDEQAMDIYNLIQDSMWDAAMSEIKASGGDIAKEKAFFQHKGTYIPHILDEDKKTLLGLVNEDKNGQYIPNIMGVKDVFNKGRKDRYATIPEINEFDKILNDNLHELYLSRIIRSNRLVFSKETEKFIKNNFSKSVIDEFRAADDGYAVGAIFTDINELFQTSARKVFADKLRDYRYETYLEINADPSAYIKPEYADNVKRIEEALEKNSERFKKAIDETYKDNPARQDEVRKSYSAYQKATRESLTKARELLDEKINEKVDELADVWKKENQKTIMDDHWQKLKEGLSSHAKDSKKFKTLFAPNMPIQELNDKQFRYLKDLAKEHKSKIDIRQYDKNVIERTNTMSRTQKIELQNSMLNLYDKFLTKWKIGNTLYSPAFHVQNALSNAFQSFLGIGADAFNPAKIKRAWNVMKLKDPKQTVTLGGTKWTYKKLEHTAKKYGVIDESFSAWDFGGKNERYYEYGVRANTIQSFKDADLTIRHPLRSITRGSTVVGTNIEGVQRMNLFMSALDQGLSIEDAAKKVDEFLFDYGDLTEFEQNVMRRIIPFYTFMRKNIPMELKQMLEQPTKFKTVDRVLDSIERTDEEGYVPENKRNEWRHAYTQIPFSGGLGVNLQLPYYQLDRLTPRKIAGSTSPLAKLIPEAVTGEYIYTEMPTHSWHNYLANQTIPTGMAYKWLIDPETGEFKENKGLGMADWTKFLAFPVNEIKDATINNYPIYDENGNYIGN